MSQWRRKGDRCAVVNNVNRILSCHCKENSTCSNKLDTVCSRTPFFSQKSRLKFERCQGICILVLSILSRDLNF